MIHVLSEDRRVSYKGTPCPVQANFFCAQRPTRRASDRDNHSRRYMGLALVCRRVGVRRGLGDRENSPPSRRESKNKR